MKIINYTKWGLCENNYETEGLLFLFKIWVILLIPLVVIIGTLIFFKVEVLMIINE